MQNLGVDVVGTNCSLGPDQMLPVVRELLETCACPVMAEPNAGLPELRGNVTVFPLGPEEFAQKTAAFAGLGARILGGCCGTTPRHLAALAQAVRGMDYSPSEAARRDGICLTSRSQLVRIGAGEALVIIGERINPTGKKVLTQELQEGRFDAALQLADQQVEAGAGVLDVNVGASLVDETSLLPELAQRLIGRLTLPLSLDSSNAEAIAKALPVLSRLLSGQFHQRRGRSHGCAGSALPGLRRAFHPAAVTGREAAGAGFRAHPHCGKSAGEGGRSGHSAPPGDGGHPGAGRVLQGRRRPPVS